MLNPFKKLGNAMDGWRVDYHHQASDIASELQPAIYSRLMRQRQECPANYWKFDVPSNTENLQAVAEEVAELILDKAAENSIDSWVRGGLVVCESKEIQKPQLVEVRHYSKSDLNTRENTARAFMEGVARIAQPQDANPSASDTNAEPLVLEWSYGEGVGHLQEITTRAQVGRDASNAIVVPDSRVSAVHGVFRRNSEGKWCYADVGTNGRGSKNGSQINGVSVEPNVDTVLYPKDVIVLGRAATFTVK